jgi:threonine synthase
MDSEFWANSSTIAFGINVPKALGDFVVLEAIYQTEGCAICIDDQSIIQEQEKLANLEGAFICPEGAATFVAARLLRESGWIKDGETVVALNTGAGIKYPNTVQIEVPTLQREEFIKKSEGVL